MKKNSKIKKKINLIISEVLKISVDKINDDIEMNKVPQWDSVGQLLIISSLEDGFKIRFSSSEISKLIDLRSITKIIESKILKR
jgi:acyl carrier protein